MTKEFTIKKFKDATVYTLESASGGGTSAGAVSSVSKTVGGTQRRSNLIAQENNKSTEPPKPRNFVAKNAKMGGAGQHRDKKKEQKQGKEKHKKPFMEDHEISMASNELKSVYVNAKKLLGLIQHYGDQGDLEAWQQSKITKAADYLNSVLQSIGGEHNTLDEISLGDYRRKAGMSQAVSQMGAAFGSDPEKRAKDLATANKRKQGLARVQARDEKARKADEEKRKAELIARLPEMKSKYAEMQAKYKSLGGSNWQYADREQNLTDREREARSMEGPMQNLLRSIHAAEKAQQEIEEGWKSSLAGLGLAGAMALGAGGAHARVTGDEDPGVNRLTGKPNVTQVEPAKDQDSKSEVVPISSRYTPGLDYSEPRVLKKDGKEYQWGGRDTPENIKGETVNAPASTIGIRSLKAVKVILSTDGKYYPAPLDEDHSTAGHGWGRGSYDSYSTTRHGRGVAESYEEHLTSLLEGLKDPKDNPCWKGYHPVGTKKKNGKTVPNCVPAEEGVEEDWQKVNRRDKTDGMSRKAVKAYRREHPGSKLKTAVTTKPSKLKKGGKAASRRKSFCARMSGMKKAHASAKTKRNPDSPINKALRRWNCEEDAYMNSLNMQVLEKLNPQAPVDTWVTDFQKADPNKYHQFKNKTPQKKAQMASAAHYAANEPSKKK